MKKILVLMIILGVTVPAFAFFGTSRFGQAPFSKDEFGVGNFGESSSPATVIESGTKIVDENNNILVDESNNELVT